MPPQTHLSPDGLFLLHTIGKNESIPAVDPWIEKYIFPNSMLPSSEQLTKATEDLFVMEDWHNFGQYYDMTLTSWWKNFDNSWNKLKKNYDEKFYRMFNTSSMQQRIYSNWRQLKFTREA